MELIERVPNAAVPIELTTKTTNLTIILFDFSYQNVLFDSIKTWRCFVFNNDVFCMLMMLCYHLLLTRNT